MLEMFTPRKIIGQNLVTLSLEITITCGPGHGERGGGDHVPLGTGVGDAVANQYHLTTHLLREPVPAHSTYSFT
jgi:hypothetical protein